MSGNSGTPFHQRTAEANRTPWYYAWDVYHVVDVYESFEVELKAIREGVGMAEMSPLSKCVVSGSEADRFVDHVITRDAMGLEVGRVLYTPWCNDDGKIVGEGLVFRAGKQQYRFTSDPSLEWLSSQAGRFDVSVRDVTEQLGILAVQGPRSREVVERATGREWSSLDFSRLVRTEIGGVEVELARQGFTGELGYEILTPTAGAIQVWDAIADAGAQVGIRPVGEHAIEVARVEAGMLIPSYDYTAAGPDPVGSHTPASEEDEYISSPFELGLGGFVDLDKAEFVGKAALVAEQANGGPPRRLVGLELDWRAIADQHLDRDIPPNISPRVRWEPLPVSVDGAKVGRASSVTWAPSVGKMVGFGHLNVRFTGLGTTVHVEWPMPTGGPGQVSAEVVVLPFLSDRRRVDR